MRSVFQCPECDKIMRITRKNVGPRVWNVGELIGGKTMDEYSCECGFQKQMPSGWRAEHKRCEVA